MVASPWLLLLAALPLLRSQDSLALGSSRGQGNGLYFLVGQFEKHVWRRNANSAARTSTTDGKSKAQECEGCTQHHLSPYGSRACHVAHVEARLGSPDMVVPTTLVTSCRGRGPLAEGERVRHLDAHLRETETAGDGRRDYASPWSSACAGSTSSSAAQPPMVAWASDLDRCTQN